jgi:hypothetical protein
VSSPLPRLEADPNLDDEVGKIAGEGEVAEDRRLGGAEACGRVEGLLVAVVLRGALRAAGGAPMTVRIARALLEDADDSL